jgi:hypothetical protein
MTLRLSALFFIEIDTAAVGRMREPGQPLLVIGRGLVRRVPAHCFRRFGGDSFGEASTGLQQSRHGDQGKVILPESMEKLGFPEQERSGAQRAIERGVMVYLRSLQQTVNEIASPMRESFADETRGFDEAWGCR